MRPEWDYQFTEDDINPFTIVWLEEPSSDPSHRTFRPIISCNNPSLIPTISITEISPMKAAIQFELENLAAEARVLSSNGAIIQTQEGRHILNLLIRIAEAASGAGAMTKPISTHHA